MNISDLRALLPALLSQEKRVLSMRLFDERGQVHPHVIPQRLEGSEGLYGGIDYTLVCLSPSMKTPLKQFEGLAVEVRIETDEGEPRLISGIVSQVTQGQSDGALTAFLLRIQDVPSLLKLRRKFRVFRNMNAVDAVTTMLDEVRKSNAVIAGSFDVELRLRHSYPAREMTFQPGMDDRCFLDRTLRREGIGWFIQPVPTAADAPPRHVLVLTDDNDAFEKNPAGDVEYKRASGTEIHDTIQHFGGVRTLVTGRRSSYSWDYKNAAALENDVPSRIDQGSSANGLAAVLEDYRLDSPHLGDDGEHYRRLGELRMQAAEAASKAFAGRGVNRHFRVGTSFILSGHPEIDTHRPHERDFILTQLDLAVENNLPKDLQSQVTHLLAQSGFTGTDLLSAQSGDTDAPRYVNRFTCSRRTVPLIPDYDPSAYPIPPMLSAIVVGPANEEIHTDEHGRIKVKILGVRPEDHIHAQGAGASDTDRDSAWVRVMTPWAQSYYGQINLPRVGAEVVLAFFAHDPDRPVALGGLYNRTNVTPAFSRYGSLPGNKKLSGIVSKEYRGRRLNQLRLDDTEDQISAQLSSEHGHTQLNLGYLTHPRQNGKGEPRGEGGELRSDRAIVVRAAELLMLTTQAMLQANGKQLERGSLLGLLEESKNLLESLGPYAAKNQALDVDIDAHQQINDDIKSAEQGSNTQPGGTERGAPLIAQYAEGGFASATPYSTVSYSGRHHNLLAQQHLQLTAGQRFNLNAGQGISMFAHKNGIKHIAHYGKFDIQAQHDSIALAAEQDVIVTASQGKVRIMADKGIELISGGAYVKIGDGKIEVGCPGEITVKAAGHNWSGAASMNADLPAFGNAPTDQRFILKYDPQGASPQIAGNRKFRIEMSDGQMVEGMSGPDGATQILQSDAMHIARIHIMEPDSE